MATISERLQYILSFNTTQAISAVDEFGKKADAALDTTDGRLDKVGGNMQKFGALSLAAAGVAGKALWSIGRGASDLNESINAVQKTFGDAAEGVLELGENAAKSVGLSRTEFAQLATGFASFASTVAGEGGDVVATVEEMTTRAADFASVLNMDVSRAVGLFQTSLAGEAEAMRRFGIDVSATTVEMYALEHGLAASKKEMTEAIKVQARYGVIMEATESMAGDFADTSGDLANSQRILGADLKNLKDNIGAGLLPFMQALVGAAKDVTTAFGGMSPELQKTIGFASGAGVAILGVSGAASFAIGSLIKMRDNLRLATAAMGKFSMAHPAVFAATLAMTAAVATAGKLWLDHSKKQEAAEERVRSVTSALNEQIAALDGTAEGIEHYNTSAGLMATGTDVLVNSITGLEEITDEERSRLNELGISVEAVTRMTLKGADGVERFADEQIRALDVTDFQAAALKKLVSGEGELTQSQKSAVSAIKSRNSEAADLIRALEVVYEVEGLATDATVKSTRVTLDAMEGTDDASKAAVRHAEALVGVQWEVATAAELVAILTGAQRALTDGTVMSTEQAIANRKAYFDATQGYIDTTAATEDLTAAQEREAEVAAQVEAAVQKVGDAYDATVQQIESAYQESIDAAQEWADDISESAEQGGDSFGTFASTASVDLGKWAQSLNEATTAEHNWKDNLAIIYERAEAQVAGSGTAMVQSLMDTGVDGAKETEALANSTEEDFAKVSAAMIRNGEEGARGFGEELDSISGHMTTAMAMAEIERSRAMIEASIKARSDARQLGKDISGGVGIGITSAAYKIRNAMRRAVESGIEAGVSAAKVRSPSKETNERIGQPMSEGIAAGLRFASDDVDDAMESVVERSIDVGVVTGSDMPRPVEEIDVGVVTGNDQPKTEPCPSGGATLILNLMDRFTVETLITERDAELLQSLEAGTR